MWYYNSYAKFKYYELKDFLPAINEIFDQGIIHVFTEGVQKWHLLSVYWNLQGTQAAGADSSIKLNTFTPYVGNLLVLRIKVNNNIAVSNNGSLDNVSDLGILGSGYNYQVLTVKLHVEDGSPKFISNDSVVIDANSHVRFGVADKAANDYTAYATIGRTALAANDVITILLLSYKQGRIVRKEEPKTTEVMQVELQTDIKRD